MGGAVHEHCRPRSDTRRIEENPQRAFDQGCPLPDRPFSMTTGTAMEEILKVSGQVRPPHLYDLCYVARGEISDNLVVAGKEDGDREVCKLQ